jgi:phosphotriesterase-related protein
MVEKARLQRMRRRDALKLLGTAAGLGLSAPTGGRSGAATSGALSTAGEQGPAHGAIVRTILRDLPPDGLGAGAALMHEHIAVLMREETAPDPVKLLIDEVAASGREGVACIVDAAIGKRSAEALRNLREIAVKSGVHIVVGGGYYTAPYPADVARKSESELVDEMLRDAALERWGALGEIGTSHEMHPDERKMLRAVSQVHARTRLPIFTHTDHQGCRQCALDQFALFESQGVDPAGLCIGHMSDIIDDPAAETHKTIAKRGAFVGMDTVGHQMLMGPKATDAMKVKTVLALLDAGYEDRILLSSDFAHQQCLKSTWGAGYSTVLGVFLPKLRYAGVKEATLHKITVENPRRFLAFVPRNLASA